MSTTVKLNYTPTERQVQAHTAKERYTLYGGAVGGGKSVWLVMEALQLSLETEGNVGFLCRNEGASLRRTTLKTLERFWPSEIIAQHHQTESYIRLVNGSLVYYGGLGDDDRAINRIKSMDLGWFAIDQAEETSESHFMLLASRFRLGISNVRYRGLLTANPAPGWVKSRFIEQSLPDHIFIPALPKDNPHLPDDYEKNLRSLYPEAYVKRLLEGDWNVTEGENYLFDYPKVREAVDRQVNEDGDVILGIDIARYGDDECVAIRRQGDKADWIETWRKTDLMQTTGVISDLIKRFQPTVTRVDVVGIGSGVVDRLLEMGFHVEGVNVGESAVDRDQFANLRAEIYWNLSERFNQGNISIPDDNNLIAELASVQYKFRSDRQKAIMSKDEMRKQGIKSPDRADALALAFLDTPEPRIDWI